MGYLKQICARTVRRIIAAARPFTADKPALRAMLRAFYRRMRTRGWNGSGDPLLMTRRVPDAAVPEHLLAQHDNWNSAPMVIAFKTLVAIACAMIVLSACVLQYTWVIWVTAPLRYLGTISYGIYLWHLPIILALKRVSWVDGPRALLPVLLLTVVFAALSSHFFERPLMIRFRDQR